MRRYTLTLEEYLKELKRADKKQYDRLVQGAHVGVSEVIVTVETQEEN